MNCVLKGKVERVTYQYFSGSVHKISEVDSWKDIYTNINLPEMSVGDYIFLTNIGNYVRILETAIDTEGRRVYLLDCPAEINVDKESKEAAEKERREREEEISKKLDQLARGLNSQASFMRRVKSLFK